MQTFDEEVLTQRPQRSRRKEGWKTSRWRSIGSDDNSASSWELSFLCVRRALCVNVLLALRRGHLHEVQLRLVPPGWSEWVNCLLSPSTKSLDVNINTPTALHSTAQGTRPCRVPWESGWSNKTLKGFNKAYDTCPNHSHRFICILYSQQRTDSRF